MANRTIAVDDSTAKRRFIRRAIRLSGIQAPAYIEVSNRLEARSVALPSGLVAVRLKTEVSEWHLGEKSAS
jgi:hypothetical protein